MPTSRRGLLGMLLAAPLAPAAVLAAPVRSAAIPDYSHGNKLASDTLGSVSIIVGGNVFTATRSGELWFDHETKMVRFTPDDPGAW